MFTPKHQRFRTCTEYHVQRERELQENVVTCRDALALRIQEAVASGEDVPDEDLQRARAMLEQVDALLTADDIEW